MLNNRSFNLALCSFVLSLLSVSASAEATSRYEFQVIDGYVSSTAILEGNYQDAIALAKQQEKMGTAYDRAVNANSLCVAYAKMADVKMAKAACAKAVWASSRIREATNMGRISRNNRNVLNALAQTAN